MDKKIKVFTLSDMPLSPSGVGTQTRYICEALLKSGKFQIRSFGGAIKHPKHEPIKTEQYGNDWIIYPVDGFGTKEMVRSLIRQEKPDILWFMTDRIQHNKRTYQAGKHVIYERSINIGGDRNATAVTVERFANGNLKHQKTKNWKCNYMIK